jgi:hypothetical protein
MLLQTPEQSDWGVFRVRAGQRQDSQGVCQNPELTPRTCPTSTDQSLEIWNRTSQSQYPLPRKFERRCGYARRMKKNVSIVTAGAMEVFMQYQNPSIALTYLKMVQRTWDSCGTG